MSFNFAPLQDKQKCKIKRHENVNSIVSLVMRQENHKNIQTHTHAHLHTLFFNDQYFRTTWVNQYQHVKPFWTLMKQETAVVVMQTRTPKTCKAPVRSPPQHTDTQFSYLFLTYYQHWKGIRRGCPSSVDSVM